MSSFVNKLANSITNTTGSIIGRDNAAKLSNSLNRTLQVTSLYRDYLKPGNVIQLIAKSTHMAVQICAASAQEPNRLVLSGHGPIGPEARHAHFTIEHEPQSGHLKFRNAISYVAYDNLMPCVLSEPATAKSKADLIRARNQFRVHEVLGNKEHFVLESVYYPGNYVCVLPDGTLTSIKNKSDERCYFFLHLISVLPQNMPIPPQQQGTVSSSSSASSLYPQTSAAAAAGGGATGGSGAAGAARMMTQKEQEAAEAARIRQLQQQEEAAAAAAAAAATSSDAPPPYQSIYPNLPRQN